MKIEEARVIALHDTMDVNFSKDDVISIAIGLLELRFNGDYKLIIDKIQEFKNYFDEADKMLGENE